MFSEFKDDQHKQQAEQLLLTFGRFNVQFERVCEAMRNAIIYTLRSQGLANQGMQQVIIGDTSSADLQRLLGALCNHLPAWDSDDHQALKNALKEIKELTEKRNVVVHSAWRFGDCASESELFAIAIRPRTKQSSGAVPEVWGFSASYLEDLIDRMKASQVLLQRLSTCLTQSGFKVATEFGRSM